MVVERETTIAPISIRELLLLAPDTTGEDQRQFRVHGIVARKRAWRDNVYIDITDGIETLVVVLPKAQKSEAISPGDRSEVVGRYGVYGTDATKCIFSSQFMITVADKDFQLDQFDYSTSIAPMVDLADIASTLAEILFVQNDFVEIECRVISTSHAPSDLDPLRLIFSGRGCPLHLEVSPLPQMIYASVMGGLPRLFTRSRLFTRQYRDGFTSAESQVLAAIASMRSNDARWATELFDLVCQKTLDWLAEQNPAQSASEILEMPSWPDVRHNEIPTVTVPTVIVRKVPPDVVGKYAYSAEETRELVMPEGFAIIEGQSGMIGNAIRYVWIAVQVERIRRLLGAYDQWRVRRSKNLSRRK